MTEMLAGDWYRQHLFKKASVKKKKPVTAKRRRTQKMNRELAEKKKTMWNEHLWNERELPICKLCGKPIQFYEDCEICHKSSRGLGGGKRDDSKVFLGHRAGNRAQGSQSLEAYLAGKTKEQLRKLCGVSE